LISANSFTGPLNLPDNGSGFSDMLLRGFSLDPTKLHVFEARWTNDTDGMEEFSIIPAGTPSVPEPGTLLLLGSGLIGLGGVRPEEASPLKH
jgi:PEP-CTERM motif